MKSTRIEKIKEQLAGRKIFLTGGTGFFGKSILDFFIDHCGSVDFEVCILTRNSSKIEHEYKRWNLLKNIKLHTGDVENFDFPKENFDTILHLATPADAKDNLQEPLRISNIICEGTKRILNLAVQNKVKYFLFASSGAVYGQQPTAISHVNEKYIGAPVTTNKGSAYGESKRMAEFLCSEYYRTHGVPSKIARCFSFVGPHLNKSGSYAVGNFMRDCIEGKEIRIKGDGTPHRSYLYAEDLVVWLLTIAFFGKDNECYNVGSDQSLSIFELSGVVAQALSKVNHPIFVEQKSTGDITRYVPDITKARDELGLDVWVSLEEAIKKSCSSR